MANVLFLLNLLLAAVLGFVIWRQQKLRSMVAFHVVGLAVAVILYMAMTYVSSGSTPEGAIPVRLVFHLVVAALAYVPFLVFLVVTYVRLLDTLADGGVSSTAMKLEDAAQALRFRHHNRAVKLVREVLEKDPDNVEARTIMGQVQLSRGHYEKSIGSFRLAMAHARDDADFAQYVFTVAVILNEHLGDAQGACRELDLIRKRMPDTPQAEKAQRWIVRIMDQAAREE